MTIIERTAKSVADRIAAGKPVNQTYDYGYELGSKIADLLYRKGYVSESPKSYCRVASGEYHLKPRDGKKGCRVEIVSAVFIGAFTQVRSMP